MRQWRKAAAFLSLLAVMAGLASYGGAGLLRAETARAEQAAEAGPAVYIVPVKHTVESGLQSFLERAFKEAEEAKAERIVLVMNTFGGAVTSAEEIGELVRKSSVPTTAFIEGKAVSAGTYIALNADQIVMEPGSTIGAAAVVNGSGDLIDNPKTVSFWTQTMMEAAKLNGRDPAIAAAMVNPDTALELDSIGKSKKAGEILTLSADEAAKTGYAEHIAGSVDETLQWLGLEGRQQIVMELSPAEQLARYLVNPYVMTVLLILGIAGIMMELFVPGFGVPGIIGVLAFGLYFFGHYVAGFAGMESVALFVLGLVMLLLEIFVPSFGVLGILGSVSLIAGVLTAASDPWTALVSLAVALLVSAAILAVSFKKYKHRGIWNKFILRDKLSTEEGYVPAEAKTSLIGLEGVALTALRPAGTALIGDKRVDVVTSGSYIEQGALIVVTKAEGTWVFVEEKKKNISS
ncbi:nodulation protein NfeD [Paenibacillus thailandensis]|uniref:Nodulation protein NfeD n=1 Tax=Paenibacillus thailandensis TaxID=393250 RepID=A0ABW5QZ25_9BACL